MICILCDLSYVVNIPVNTIVLINVRMNPIALGTEIRIGNALDFGDFAMLQCVAACCSVFKCGAVCGNDQCTNESNCVYNQDTRQQNYVAARSPGDGTRIGLLRFILHYDFYITIYSTCRIPH